MRFLLFSRCLLKNYYRVLRYSSGVRVSKRWWLHHHICTIQSAVTPRFQFWFFFSDHYSDNNLCLLLYISAVYILYICVCVYIYTYIYLKKERGKNKNISKKPSERQNKISMCIIVHLKSHWTLVVTFWKRKTWDGRGDMTIKMVCARHDCCLLVFFYSSFSLLYIYMSIYTYIILFFFINY